MDWYGLHAVVCHHDAHVRAYKYNKCYRCSICGDKQFKGEGGFFWSSCEKHIPEIREAWYNRVILPGQLEAFAQFIKEYTDKEVEE